MSETLLVAPRPIGLAGLLRPPPARPDAAARLAAAEARGRAVAAAEAAAAQADAVAALKHAHAAELAARDEAEAALGALAASAIAGVERAFADALAHLALAAARAVLAREPAVTPETLAAIVADVLAAAPERTGTIFVAPGDAGRLGAVPGWSVAADPALAPGDVRAEIDTATIRSGIAHRVGLLADTLASGIEP
jgi:flagellar biosynthesis/type III secretory pathway protein FliH